MESFVVLMSLWRLDTVERIFSKDLPRLVMREDFLPRLLVLYFVLTNLASSNLQ